MKKYKRVKRVYFVRFSDYKLSTTRLSDVFRFLAKWLLSDCERGSYLVEFEVFRYE